MLTKKKALYQAKLILDNLPQDEYNMIPQNEIDYIENNFEYDKSISINPEISLEDQNIDDTTYEILDKIVKSIQVNQNTNNTEYNIQSENIKLKKLVEFLKKENSKIPKIKNLLKEYDYSLKQKDVEIAKLKKENEILNEYIKIIPKFIRKIFIKKYKA